MEKFSWHRFFIKLTSRKFITALGGMIVSLCAVLAVPNDTATQLVGVAGAVLSALGYIFVEGYNDSVSHYNDIPETDSKEENK